MNDIYICNRCNAAFTADEAATETFHHNEYEHGGVEVFLACPSCGSSDYDDAAYCAKCGNPFRYGDLRGGYYCDECIADMTNTHLEHEFIREEIDCYAEWLHERKTAKALDDTLDYLKRKEWGGNGKE